MKRGVGSKRELKNANRTLLNKKEKRKKLTKFQINYVLKNHGANKMKFKIGQTVKFGNLPTLGRVQMSNDLETFVIWNDGDKCAVATECLKGVEE